MHREFTPQLHSCTEGCPQANSNWCTPLNKCGWVPLNSGPIPVSQKAAPGQKAQDTSVPASATTSQVFWFGAWKHLVCNHPSGVLVRCLEALACNHQWEVTPLLVLWFGAGVPP